VAGGQRLLLGLGLAQLALQLADVGFALLQHGVEFFQFLLQHGGRLGQLRLLHQGALGEILASLGERQFRLLLPAPLRLGEAGETPVRLLLLGDGLGRGRAHLDQGVLHLLDHQADDLLGLLGPVEDGVEVGIDDVGEAGEDTHRCRSLSSVSVISVSVAANARHRPGLIGSGLAHYASSAPSSSPAINISQ